MTLGHKNSRDFLTWGGGGGGAGGIFCTDKHPILVSTAAPVFVIANLESETKKDCALKSSFNAWHNSGSLMSAIPYNVHLYTGEGGGGGGVGVL